MEIDALYEGPFDKRELWLQIMREMISHDPYVRTSTKKAPQGFLGLSAPNLFIYSRLNSQSTIF